MAVPMIKQQMERTVATIFLMVVRTSKMEMSREMVKIPRKVQEEAEILRVVIAPRPM